MSTKLFNHLKAFGRERDLEFGRWWRDSSARRHPFLFAMVVGVGVFGLPMEASMLLSSFAVFPPQQSSIAVQAMLATAPFGFLSYLVLGLFFWCLAECRFRELREIVPVGEFVL